MNITRPLMLLCMATVLAGCKVAVIVGEGGEVQSLSGLRYCGTTSYCPFEVTDTNFSEGFTAIPKPGFEFVRWQKGSGFFCGDSTATTCTVSLPGSPFSDVILALYDTGYVMPVFKDVGIDSDGDGVLDRQDLDDDNDGVDDLYDFCPLNPDLACNIDTITVEAKEWAQVDIFTNLSWYDLNRVCRGGPCVDGGVLNGYNMTGWTWASVNDVNALFNYYIGSQQLGPGPDDYSENPSTWGGAMFSAGWRPTHFNGGVEGVRPTIYAWLPEKIDDGYGREVGRLSYWYSYISDATGLPGSRANTQQTGSLAGNVQLGAWFYRTP